MAGDTTGFPVLAVYAGLLGPLVNLLLGAVAMAMGLKRGYLREGFLHGMLLGLLGLLTVRLLKRRARATAAIQHEINTLSRDRLHILFFSALLLFYIALGLGYSVLALRLSTGRDGPELLWAGAGTALLLGYAAFSYACPPLRWLPVLGDWAEYQENPTFACQLRYRFERQALEWALWRLDLWASLGCLLAIAGCSAVLAAIAASPKVWAPWFAVLGSMLAGAGVVLSGQCSRLVLRAGLALDAHAVAYVELDPRWHPAIPRKLRLEVAGLQLRRSCCDREYLVQRYIYYLWSCLAGAGLFLTGLALSQRTAAAAVCAGLLCLAAGAMLLRQRRPYRAVRQALLAERGQYAAEHALIVGRIVPLIEEYHRLRSAEELAFRHEAIPQTLISREIQFTAGRYTAPPIPPDAAAAPEADAAAPPAVHPGEVLLHRRHVLERAWAWLGWSALASGLAGIWLLLSGSGVSLIMWALAVICLTTGWALHRQARRLGAHPEAARARRWAAARSVPPAHGSAAEPALLHELNQLRNKISTRFIASALLLAPACAYGVWQLAQLLSPGPETGGGLLAALLWLGCTAPPGIWLWLNNRRDMRHACEIEAALQPTGLQRRITIQLGYFNRYLVSIANRLRLLWGAALLLLDLAVFSAARLTGLNPGPFSPAAALALATGLALAAGWLGVSLGRLQRAHGIWKGRVIESLREVRRERYRSASVLREQVMVREQHDGYAVEYEPRALDEATIERWVELDFAGFGVPDRLAGRFDRARSLAFSLSLLGCFINNALSGAAGFARLSNGIFIASAALLLVSGGLWLAQRVHARLQQQA